ncbi:MAG: hypothetical protein F6K31_29360 [Symploca sp. SIO2G7]|nr:hypothetical protein [Symploca sp. SIO2G7]
MQQLEYWFADRPDGFYKFLEPCSNEKYRQGDSWAEELAYTPDEFRAAFDCIGFRYRTKTEFTQSQDKFQGKFYCSYFDKRQGLTYYFRNHETVETLLDSLIYGSSTEMGISIPRDGNTHLQKWESQSLEMGISIPRDGNTHPASIYTENTTENTADIIPPCPPAGGQQKQPDSEQLNLGLPDSGIQSEDLELNRKAQLPKDSSSLAKKTEILDTPEGSRLRANYSATANENDSHYYWSPTIVTSNGSPDKGTKEVMGAQGKVVKYGIFLQAYLAEKPSNFVDHRSFNKDVQKKINELIQKFGNRSLDIFVAAFIWVREEKGGWWRNASFPPTALNLATKSKIEDYADKHFAAMESDPQYRARVEGRAPSMDKGRNSNGCVTNDKGEVVTGATAEIAIALATDPMLNFFVENANVN